MTHQEKMVELMQEKSILVRKKLDAHTLEKKSQLDKLYCSFMTKAIKDEITELKRRIELNNSVQYFTAEDEQDILSWSNPEAKKCWEIIKAEVKRAAKNGAPINLGSIVCPFCMKTLRVNGKWCGSCFYGKKHGKCTELDSTWQAVTRTHAVDIPNKFYTDLIKRLDSDN